MDHRGMPFAKLWMVSAFGCLACSGSKGPGGGTRGGSDAGLPSGGSGGGQMSTRSDRGASDGGGGTVSGSDAGLPLGGSGGGRASSGADRGGRDGGGDAASGRDAGGGAGGSSAPTVTCSTVARCATKVVDGDVFVDKDNPATNYVGTTEFTGDLNLYTLVDVSSFEYLETVDGKLVFVADAEGEKLVGAFPNLRRVVRGIEYSRPSGSIVDACTFRSLESPASIDIVGSDLSGELNLSSLREFFRIQVRSSLLRTLTLPSNGKFTAGQLRLQGNTKLTNIYGFENVQLTGSASAAGSYSVYISNNPLLPTCRAHDTAQQFIDAGYSPTSITVESSAPAP